CQVVRTASAASERAADATAGLVLARDGVPVPIYYSASCGGHTEVPSAVWPGADDPPYLPAQPDDACGGAPAWTANITASDLTRAFKAAGLRGDRLRDMTIVSRDASGRVSKLRLNGFSPDQISGQDLRMVVGRTLGFLLVKSAAFQLERERDTYRFEGRGYGHGVGLCVIGSVNLAARGQTAAQILNRYFPGLDIVPLGAPEQSAPALLARSVTAPPQPATLATALSGIALTFADATDAERSSIESLAARARDEIATQLGVAPPSRVVIRVHPSTQSYEQATGQPWFTSGAIVDGDVHLLPASVLRERGVLERTLRRELAHVMIDESLANRPAWVREGAAIYASGGRPEPAGSDSPFRPRSRLACPEDIELLQPVSAGALSNASARALACFARQAGDGRSWKDIK
ncbi:MAG TPA: SpoIID/LytB domain-containing protein, partial [Vicinamibacterales bacterium]|nr:SpoIID/LytB domain-containing protein [Vicinamibacterales bacterium]